MGFANVTFVLRLPGTCVRVRLVRLFIAQSGAALCSVRLTLEIMFHKRHRIIILASAHGADTR